MKNFTMILSFFLCFTLVADDHIDKKETMKDKFMNNPNYLMDFKECKEMKDFIIKPDGWNMNGKEKFHGITQERALKEGVDIKNVLTEYKNDIDNHCCKLVCHNLNFDKTIVVSELMRLDMNVNDVESFCTMKNTINYCKLTPMVRGEYKWPSLEQLYYKCFNEDIDNAHNSKYDVINTAKCYFKYQLL